MKTWTKYIGASRRTQAEADQAAHEAFELWKRQHDNMTVTSVGTRRGYKEGGYWCEISFVYYRED